MSTQVTTWMVAQYQANVTVIYQQQGSLLRGTVRERSVTGEFDYWDRMGPTSPTQKTVRHAPTPLVNTPHSRRQVTLLDWEWADLIDPVDKLKTIHTFESEYAINGGLSLGREWDRQLLIAFAADAKAGKAGGTTVTFTSEAALEADYSAAAFTTPNVLTVKLALDNKIAPRGNRHIVVPPLAIEQLLKASSAPQASSADYNTIRALVAGEINTWVGFEWHVLDLDLFEVNPSQATEPQCYAWHRDSMGVSQAMEIVTDIGIRRDLSNATQVYLLTSFGATRIMGQGVVRFWLDTDN
ncbi:hypothetical protein LCGC14_1838500 [marine sediment metagenome]|uniref:Uncharacterized protein n=1 Tax=marine sediment metagenome TaxID=412755 RepID=A0A0F9GE20_9ZZZZ